MSKVMFDMSMSLDGYVMATGSTPEEPLGKGGQRLHDWAMGDQADRDHLAALVEQLGATICGRRTYDTSLPGWGPDGPSGSARKPVIVVTHRAPEESPEGGVYTFATDGLESALEQARAAADGKTVVIMGGPDVGCQFIRAGLVDQISVHLAPVLFGGGTGMFDHLGDDHIKLEVDAVVDTPLATHVVYNIVK